MIKLIDILKEVTEGPSDKEAAYQDLIKSAEKGSNVAKGDIYKKLVDFTYKYYKSELGNLASIFPADTKVKNWRDYVRGSEQRNVGEKVEVALVNYAEEKGSSDAKRIGTKGHDISVDGKTLEVKSSEGDKPQLMLQTSFFKPDANRFYAIVTGTKTSDLTVSLISSDLLYKVALGNLIEDQVEDPGTMNKLKQAVKTGLDQIDLTGLIYNTLKTGRDDEPLKSFNLGNGVRVRFIVQLSYEPGLQSKADKAAAKSGQK